MTQQQAILTVLDDHAVDRQERAIPDWTQEYTQMSNGLFYGQTIRAQMGRVELFEERINQRVGQVFATPANVLVFGFNMNEGTLYLLGDRTLRNPQKMPCKSAG